MIDAGSSRLKMIAFCPRNEPGFAVVSMHTQKLNLVGLKRTKTRSGYRSAEFATDKSNIKLA